MKLDHAEKRARLALTGDIAVERLDRHDRENPGYELLTTILAHLNSCHCTFARLLQMSEHRNM